MDKIEETIGVAIITFKRFWSFKRVFNSIPKDKINQLIIINGTPLEDNKEYDEFFDKYIKENGPSSINVFNSPGKCVGINKNVAFTNLLHHKHIFIIEDDIEIINPCVFDKYIETARLSGLPHLMFAYHGTNNKDQNGNPKPILKLDYGNTIVWFNGGCVGAFNYYERDCLLRVGLMDERYTNANEHISHTYRYVQFGFLPAYRWYPDISDSHLYLKETASPVEASVIGIDSENIKRNHLIFKECHTPPNEPIVGFPNYQITQQDIIIKCRGIKSRNLMISD